MDRTTSARGATLGTSSPHVLGLLDILAMLPLEVLRRAFGMKLDGGWRLVSGADFRATCKQARDLLNQLPEDIVVPIRGNRAENLSCGAFLSRLPYLRVLGFVPGDEIMPLNDATSDEVLIPALIRLHSNRIDSVDVSLWKLTLTTFALLAQGLPNLKHLQLLGNRFLDDSALRPLAACQFMHSLVLESCDYGHHAATVLAPLSAIASLRELTIEQQSFGHMEPDIVSCEHISSLTQLTKLRLDVFLLREHQVHRLSSLTNLQELLLPKPLPSSSHEGSSQAIHAQVAHALRSLAQLRQLCLPALGATSLAALQCLTQLTCLIVRHPTPPPLDQTAAFPRLPALVKVGCIDEALGDGSTHQSSLDTPPLAGLAMLLDIARPGATLQPYSNLSVQLGSSDVGARQYMAASLARVVDRSDSRYMPTSLQLDCQNAPDLAARIEALGPCPWVTQLSIYNANDLLAPVAGTLIHGFPHLHELRCRSCIAEGSAFLAPLLALPQLRDIDMHDVRNVTAADLTIFRIMHPGVQRVCTNTPGFDRMDAGRVRIIRQAYGLV